MVTVSLESYEFAFSKIRKVTGIVDTKELVERFKQVEDKNFSLFNYVNEINNQVELYAEEIIETQHKIDALKIKTLKNDQETKLELVKLEEKLKDSVDKQHVFEHQNNEIGLVTTDLTKTIETLVVTLQSIARSRQVRVRTPVEGEELDPELVALNQKRQERLLQMIDFAPPSDPSGAQVVESNLVQYLGLIEQKSNELLTLNYIINSPKKVAQLMEGSDLLPAGGVAGLLGQGPVAQVGLLTIVTPSTLYTPLTSDEHEFEDGSEDDERPLSRDELKQRTVRGLQKREKNANVSTKQIQKKGRKGNKKE